MVTASIDFMPVVDWPNFRPTYEGYEQIKRDALDEARITLDLKKLKSETLTWAGNHLTTNEIAALNLVDEWQFYTVGKYHYIMNQGGLLDNTCIEWLEPKMAEIMNNGQAKLSEKQLMAKKKAETPDSITDREVQVGQMMAMEMEELILTGIYPKDHESAYNILFHLKPTPTTTKHIIATLQEFVDEFVEFDEEEIEQGFNGRDQMMASREAYLGLLNIAKTFTSNAKTRRKAVRKRKITSRSQEGMALKATEGVKFKAEDHEFQIVSVDPSQIIGAKSILVFNTKNRKLGLYVAADDEGLQVKGTTIYGFDEELSEQKTLRKAKTQLDSFRQCTKKRAEIIFRDYIKAKTGKMNGRLSGHVVIMKVWKK